MEDEDTEDETFILIIKLLKMFVLFNKNFPLPQIKKELKKLKDFMKSLLSYEQNQILIPAKELWKLYKK
jgi:hypothetical protein